MLDWVKKHDKALMVMISAVGVGATVFIAVFDATFETNEVEDTKITDQRNRKEVTKAVEAMCSGAYDRALAILKPLQETHRNPKLIFNNLGHIAMRRGSLTLAKSWYAQGRGSLLGAVINMERKCQAENAEGCFGLGEHYRKIFDGNVADCRATGRLAEKHYKRGCALKHLPSCDALEKLEHSLDGHH